MSHDINSIPHRRYNILTGEWILCSPHRTKRAWQGKTEKDTTPKKETYDPSCYLCPGNTRSTGDKNPDYQDPYTFINDFCALLIDSPVATQENGLMKAETEIGICKVVCFSPDHSLTLPLMEEEDIILNHRKRHERDLQNFTESDKSDKPSETKDHIDRPFQKAIEYLESVFGRRIAA